MGGLVKGDVVVLPFPFSDLSASKKRPALVIAPLPAYSDVILCMITSRSARDDRAVPISRMDFVTGDLPRDSNVRPNRLFTADASIILRTAGRLTTSKIDDVVAEIIEIISA